MWAGIIKMILEALIKVGVRKKKEADASKVKSVEKTLDSVGAAREVEKDVRDKQRAIDKDASTVATNDGGLDFGAFNNDDAKKEEGS